MKNGFICKLCVENFVLIFFVSLSLLVVLRINVWVKMYETWFGMRVF